MQERYIKRPFFFEKALNSFHIGVKKLVNEVINEIFRQMTITLTLRLDVLVRSMDRKGQPFQRQADFRPKKSFFFFF